MNNDPSRRALDFWAALFLIGLSLLLLAKTTALPFFDASSGGVDSGAWYNSAALTPYVVFGALLALSLGLLWVAIRDGGAAAALGGLGAPMLRRFAEGDVQRGAAVAAILLLYIFALVPRVDFIIATALLVTALVYGFHESRTRPMLASLAAIAVPGAYALIVHFPQSDWERPNDDDWLSLAAFLAITVFMWIETARANDGRTPSYARATPLVAILAPLLLVLAMAFGFRQNVPNRSGLIFKQIEYHYYVTLRPLWAAAKR